MNLIFRTILILGLQSIFLSVFADNLDVFTTVKRYYDVKQEKQYIELAYLIPGNVVAYKTVANNKDYQAKVLVAIQLINQTNEEVFKHVYVVNSPQYKENTQTLVNLSDVVNIPFVQDSLELSMQFLDLNDSTNYFTDNIEINKLIENTAFLSDISLLSDVKDATENSVFVKNEKELTPKFINYYPTEVSTIQFYAEAYHSPSTSYFVRYYITNENNKVIEKYANFKKLSSSENDAILSGFDITTLPSGNYYIYAELRNDKNEVADRKRMFFQRYNKLKEDLDVVENRGLGVIENNFAKKYDLRNITHHLNALKPIADKFEEAAINGAIDSKDLALMQNYFYSFWSKRDSKNPEDRWMEYANLVKFADDEFGNTMIEGNETSRGITYLKYGKPTERLERNTRDFGRIEVWTYEFLEGQGNVKFMFVENPLAQNEFPLVHSTLKNQMFDKEWDRIIKNNNY
ncbi:MAG: GWxTD domain-containing protein [Bacteroidetes bacterium]|nr:GWxTD domain-containing protein [Bacteroidota bacterium]MCB9226764.1 GWxTD domain-containing protein [Chitinophagales bacterium]